MAVKCWDFFVQSWQKLLDIFSSFIWSVIWLFFLKKKFAFLSARKHSGRWKCSPIDFRMLSFFVRFASFCVCARTCTSVLAHYINNSQESWTDDCIPHWTINRWMSPLWYGWFEVLWTFSYAGVSPAYADIPSWYFGIMFSCHPWSIRYGAANGSVRYSLNRIRYWSNCS